MNKIILVFIIAVCISCGKKSPTKPLAASSVSMEVNGVPCSFTGNYKFSKSVVYLNFGQSTSYIYLAMLPITYSQGNYNLQVKLFNDSVINGQNYTVANQAGMTEYEDIVHSNSLDFTLLGKYNDLYFSNYDFYLKVDNIVNNKATGHFQGLLICNGLQDTLHISNGQFSDVEVQL